MLDLEQEKLWQLIVMRGTCTGREYIASTDNVYENYRVDYDRYVVIRNAENNRITQVRKL